MWTCYMIFFFFKYPNNAKIKNNLDFLKKKHGNQSQTEWGASRIKNEGNLEGSNPSPYQH